jgi:leader peptidase (prepilin peptidase) / N-methyltransferase
LHTLEPSTDPTAPTAVEESRAVARVWRRPLVIGLAALLAVACVLRYEADAHGFISAFTAAVLVVLAAIDLQERVIPNRIVVPAAAIVLVAQLAFYPDRAGEWIVSALGAALFLFIPAVIKRGAIGMGDVKLAVLLGAATGYAVLPALTFGFLALVPVAIYMLFREGSAARKKYLPLGPFLALGTLVVLLSGAVA